MSVTHADFTIERRYPYTPRQTFSAFAEPELRRQWFANPGGWDDAEWELDFRVGGGERQRAAAGGSSAAASTTSSTTSGSCSPTTCWHDGRLISVSLTTVEFVAEGEGTHLRFTEQGVVLRRRDRRRPARARDGQAARRARPLPRGGAGPMTLTLHEHPFAAYCWKALIAFYERDVPFERVFVGGAEDRARLAELWPVGSIPVLVDGDRRAGRVDDDRRVRRRPRSSPGLDAAAVGPRDRRPGDDADAEDRRRQPAARGRAATRTASTRRAPRSTAPTRCSTTTSTDGLARRRRRSAVADCAAAPALFYAYVVHRWDEAVTRA